MKYTFLISSALGLALAANTGHAENYSVDQRINTLEQEISLLKRQQEVEKEKADSDKEKAAKTELGKKGLSITSPDGKYGLSLGTNIQLDARHFINDQDKNGKDDILSRQIRPILEGKAGNASFRFVPDFAGGTTRVLDAHVDYKFADPFKVRVGKFKPPIGLERLQSPVDMFFMEPGHPTNLVPNRDYGIQLYGEAIPNLVDYQLAIMNGNGDQGNTDGDDDNKKDIDARIFSTPFRTSDIPSLQGLGVGVGGGYGKRVGTPTKTILGDYKTPGQLSFFKYRTGTLASDTTYASGTQWRLSPQAYWYSGNKGLLAEYVISTQDVTRSTSTATLHNSAWQVVGSYVITGEDVTYKGSVKPYQDFDIRTGGIGAWEVVARVGQTNVDDDAFPFFADPAKAARLATSAGTGLNWYLSENLKMMVDYDYTKFDGGKAGNDDRDAEQALVSRLQFRM
ncbi:MAG: porin [Alphaproteobacteria bacterium]|nr:porin [Alphaproteobacteria bacterium]